MDEEASISEGSDYEHDADELQAGGEEGLSNIGSEFADVGIVERLRVENFMCHRCFEFVFGPNVNIINGENGSGKSAIVAALQIGLGAKTSSTERGKTLASHIKHGERYALITIRIKNRKSGSYDNRYRSDTYGSVVVIERKLMRTGGQGGWTFRNDRMQRVKLDVTPREELTRILDHFNLQVDNPISILTQQKSKKFLKSGKESGLYKLFMEATCLENVKRDLMITSRTKHEMAEMIGKKRSFVEETSRELETLKRSYDDAREMRGLEARIEALEQLWAWTRVAEDEERIRQQKNALTTADEKLSKLADEEKSAEEGVQVAKTELDRLRSQIDSATNELRAHMQQVTSSNEELKAQQLQISTLEKTKRNCEAVYQEALRRASRLEKDLHDARLRHANSHGVQDDIEAQLRDKQAEKRRVEENVRSAQDSLEAEVAGQRKLQDERRKYQLELQSLHAAVDRAKAEVALYVQAEKNSLARWGARIPELLRRIDEVFRSGDPNLPILLSKDMRPAIDATEARVEEIRQRASQVEVKLKGVETKLVEASTRERDLRQVLSRSTAELSVVETDIVRLEAKLDEVSSGFDASSWEVQIQQCTSEAEAEVEKKAGVESQLQSIHLAVEKIKRKKERDVEGGEAIEMRQEQLHKALDDGTEKYKRAMAQLNQKRKILQKITDRIAQARSQSETNEAQLAKDIENAQLLAPERLERGEKSSEQLETELGSMKTRLVVEQERRSGRSLLDLEKEYVEARAKKAKTDRDLEKMDYYLARVQSGYAVRKKKYFRLRKLTKVATNLHFKYFMQRRKHIGELVFDDKGGEHGEGTLSFNVAMANHRTKSGGFYRMKDMSSLSGGEANYTTLSFMLALGESMQIPVRVMDEFDVYMDEQGRRASYETLIEVTNEFPGRQFIFITPLQLPNVRTSDRVKIQKLLPPDRSRGRQQLMDGFVE